MFVEKQVIAILQKYVDPKTNKNFLAESIVSQVGVGAGNPNVDAGSASETPYKGKVTVNFSEFKFRQGINTADILEEIRGKVKGIAGASVTVEKDANGPPAGYPISIQLTGADYDQMLKEADKMIAFINAKNIPTAFSLPSPQLRQLHQWHALSNYKKKFGSPYEVIWSNQWEPSTKTQHASSHL